MIQPSFLVDQQDGRENKKDNVKWIVDDMHNPVTIKALTFSP
jgi:hypothetical protein